MKIGSKVRGVSILDFGFWIADFRFADLVGRFCETPSRLGGVWHRRLQPNATICQILAAPSALAHSDLRRFDQRDVRRAHVTIYRSFFDLVETGNLPWNHLDNPRSGSQMRACYRIYGFGSAAMARATQPSTARDKNVDGFWPRPSWLRGICGKR